MKNLSSTLLDTRQFLVGFESLFQELDRHINNPQGKFPPHDLVQTDESTYQLSLAVAGFSKKEISLEQIKNKLIIKGTKIKTLYDNPDVTAKFPIFLHHGIGNRSFSKEFTLASNVVVRGAKFEDGILTIDLEYVMPEDKASFSIEID